MKKLLCCFVLLFSCLFGKAQDADFEIKVVSKKYQNVKGKLQKVNAEGIAIEDYKGNYLIFRATEIVKLKIRRRGLTIGKAAGTGALAGLAIGGSIWSLDENGESFEELAKLTAALTVAGTAIGTLTGIIAEISNTKLTIQLDGNEDKFKKLVPTLEKYVNMVYTEHVN